MKDLLELFFCFARIGVCTFGGGYAMLPMFNRELVSRRGWATEEELVDYYAMGQCTPGVIAVNTSTFVGYKLRGVPGAIFATAGMVTPCIIIISIIAAFLSNFGELAVVQHAFSAIRVVVGVLILNAVTKMWKTSVKNKRGVCLALLAFFVSVILSPSPILIVLGAAAVGLLWPAKKGGA